MSAIDDILYAPITEPPIVDSTVITQIALCLGDPNLTMTFKVDNRVSLATYHRIVEIVEKDRVIFKTARQFCASDPHGNFRPPGALTMKTLFETLHADPNHTQYIWTTRGSVQGVVPIQFANVFSIVSGLPTVMLADGGEFEWWALGLMSRFAGSGGYYCFADQQDALNYWSSP